MTLKEKMKQGPVFGMACFTGTTCVIENIAMSGLDFIYLDLEHTDWMLGEDFEKQIMAAKLHDISVLVRMADDDEVAIHWTVSPGRCCVARCRRSSPVSGCRRGGHCGLAHGLALGVGEQGRGGLLHHLLVPALQAALTFAQVQDVAVGVGQHLDLDVAGPLDQLLHQQGRVAEGGQGLAAGGRGVGE